MNSYESLITSFLNNYDFIPLLFEKSCGYQIIIPFYKKSTHWDIYKIIPQMIVIYWEEELS